ncbi:thioredoxin [Natronobacterium gregoryi]|uniref:Thioredoxin n=2 Tax=Natronobacterium gregoryi TaxID=44930 RepID=L0AFG8_NATGS|nr:thioredoxin [Natronobacterium gregoryi]AFZ71892.1 thioredoxin [Natronobacterium gregoryi SP2]ELY62487.1 thioredoxin [Natronobacterium gregoryi SP2]PLK20678.1 thioredoxin [Natronobacterium gregoryi SP2]SFJ14666.1 thioredoxin [Natronobacterium gregoryi]
MATDAHSGTNGTPADEPLYVDGEQHLDDVVTDHDVVLVDFYADWCGPCQMLEPVLETLAEETDAVIAKVDVDEHQLLAGDYGVRGVPTILLFADGEQVEQHVGVLPEDRLRGLIDEYTE